MGAFRREKEEEGIMEQNCLNGGGGGKTRGRNTWKTTTITKDILKTSYGDLLLRKFLKKHTYVCEKNLN